MTSPSNAGSVAISRRTLLTSGVVAGSTSLLLSTSASATARLSQDAVHFEVLANNDHNCGVCKHFMAPSACRFVEGAVSSSCSCWIWTRKLA